MYLIHIVLELVLTSHKIVQEQNAEWSECKAMEQN
jgi:hypothetical protein